MARCAPEDEAWLHRWKTMRPVRNPAFDRELRGLPATGDDRPGLPLLLRGDIGKDGLFEPGQSRAAMDKLQILVVEDLSLTVVNAT